MVKHLRQIPLDTYKTLREVVIENIRDAILSGDFPAGMRLTELQLADEMGVSRTPIREAIRNLEQEGLVVMIPRRVLTLPTYQSMTSMKSMRFVRPLKPWRQGLRQSASRILKSRKWINISLPQGRM